MSEQSYSVTIVANATPQRAYESINRVTAWWTTDLTGGTTDLNDSFTVHFGDVHISTQKLVELIPNQQVVWLVTGSKINFVDDKQEWTGTHIIFDLVPNGKQTKIRFTHDGLKSGLECFSACSNAWSEFIVGSLLPLINIGKGNPSGAV